MRIQRNTFEAEFDIVEPNPSFGLSPELLVKCLSNYLVSRDIIFDQALSFALKVKFCLGQFIGHHLYLFYDKS